MLCVSTRRALELGLIAFGGWRSLSRLSPQP